MCTGRRVGKGRPACYLRNCLVGENEDPGLSGVPVSGKQDGLRLPCQSGEGNLRKALLTGLRNSGIDPPQIHVRRHDEGNVLKESVPGGILRRLILPFQCNPGEFLSIVRHGHDLELDRSRAIAGEQMYRELQTAIGCTVGNELGVCSRLGDLQLSQNIPIALPGK